MTLGELFIVAVALSMDAFAVAVCKGLSVKRASMRQSMLVGVYFGGFQALMPLIGYLLGATFESLIASVAHWVAFILLALIGGNMIRESFSDEDECVDCSFAVKTLVPLAVATSIDALVTGVTFAALAVDIVPAVLFIGVTTFALSTVGVRIGHGLGKRFKTKAEFAGGLVLVLMGLKILLEHLGIMP